ncbi:ABC transporter substrate-binding protein [Telmatospirillum siberiense]|uniref:ABC transporter substrate-binding protein n=1 Tax=Telmatospirillum siberiense TaxID=382514 RepID=A0A2N3PNW9_9PROT|nr:ABC transporter substrate-binding protein [Telmatospirillum siberiense]PKU22096.1 ABC transporter substrate-binding protein [Telmatospirillum siberiense]
MILKSIFYSICLSIARRFGKNNIFIKYKIGISHRIVAVMLFFSVMQPAFAVDSVTVGLSVYPSVADGGIWAVGDELGLWEKENLEVKVLTFQGAGVLVPQVASGNVTIGLPSPETILAAFAAGQTNLPIRFFYNVIPVNTMEFAVLADSQIHEVADLKNKKIGVGALTWGNIPSTRAVLKEAGLKAADYSIVPVGVLSSGFHALTAGEVDALNYNSGWHDILELSGTPLRRIKLPGVIGAMSANAFIAHAEALEKNPDLFIRFGRAFTAAEVACAANVRFCVEAFWRQHPEARPKEGDLPQAVQNAVEVVRRRLDRITLFPDGSPREPGAFDLLAIRRYVRQMALDGEFVSDNVPVDQLFTNRLVADFAKFDSGEIRTQARLAQ